MPRRDVTDPHLFQEEREGGRKAKGGAGREIFHFLTSALERLIIDLHLR